MTPAELRKRLRAAKPFSGLSETTLQRLLEHAQVENLPRGAVLFREGERAESVHFVLEGSIGLAASAEKPGATIVEIFREGELFVAPASMLRLPYLVSAVVLAPARVLAIPAADFRPLLDHDLALARGMNDVLARHWRVLVEQVKDLKLRSSSERLAVYLLALARDARSGQPALVDLKEPRKSLAARLNMTPENLSRGLVGLRAHGVTNSGRTGIRIASVDRLRSFAYAPPGRSAPSRRRRRAG